MPPLRPAAFARGRAARAVALALALALAGLAAAGCGKRQVENTPESVADAFVEAYFRQMDQQRAKEFTALGATRMLETELKEVQEVRKDGYSPGSVAVTVHRGEPSPREQRIRIPYQIEVQMEDGKRTSDADIELTKIDGAWKVVRVGVTAREPPKPDGT